MEELYIRRRGPPSSGCVFIQFCADAGCAVGKDKLECTAGGQECCLFPVLSSLVHASLSCLDLPKRLRRALQQALAA